MVKEKLDILAIGVHPDDVELGCGGTVIKHIKLGYKVGILDLTQGELGSRGSAELRLKEAEKARKYAGALVRENIGLKDGLFINDETSKMKIIEVIRKYQPDIVLANTVKDRHPDHSRAATLISESCFLSGLIKINTEIQGEKQSKWRPKKIFHYVQDQYVEPDFLVDVTDHFEDKMKMVLCFESQFYSTDDSSQVKTPISGKDFLEFLEARAKEFGRKIGVKYAEGFVDNSFVGISDITKVL